jgi:hypothetical protein
MTSHCSYVQCRAAEDGIQQAFLHCADVEAGVTKLFFGFRFLRNLPRHYVINHLQLCIYLSGVEKQKEQSSIQLKKREISLNVQFNVNYEQNSSTKSSVRKSLSHPFYNKESKDVKNVIISYFYCHF